MKFVLKVVEISHKRLVTLESYYALRAGTPSETITGKRILVHGYLEPGLLGQAIIYVPHNQASKYPESIEGKWKAQLQKYKNEVARLKSELGRVGNK